MATQRQISSKTDNQEKSNGVLKLLCVSSLTALLTVGCASMSESPEPETQASKEVTKQMNQAAAEKAEAAVEKKVEQAEEMMEKLAKPVEPEVKAEPVVKAKPKPEPKPVVKAAPKPKPVVKKKEVVVAKPKPKPAPVVEKVAEKKVAPVVEKVVEKTVVKAVEPVEKKVAETVKPIKEKVSAKTGALSSSVAKSLPVSVGMWQVQQGAASYDDPVVLSSPTMQMGEGRFLSQVYVTVMQDKILVVSSSEIAEKRGQSGIRINGKKWLPFNKVIDGGRVGVIDGDWLGSLSRGGKVEVRAGFFPGANKKPEQHVSALSIDDMSQAIPKFRSVLKKAGL